MVDLRIKTSLMDYGTFAENHSSFFLLRQSFLESECLQALEDRGEADVRQRAAEQIIQKYHIDPAPSRYIRATATMWRSSKN